MRCDSGNLKGESPEAEINEGIVYKQLCKERL